MTSRELEGPDPAATAPVGYISPLRVGLRTLLISVAAVAIWLSYYSLRRERVELEVELRQLHDLERNLQVVEPDKLAAVRKRSLRREDVWEVYIPSQRPYEVRLATERVKVFEPEAFLAKRLSPGIHRIELKAKRGREESEPELWIDGDRVQDTNDALKPRAWLLTSEDDPITRSRHYPADQPLLLLRRHIVSTRQNAEEDQSSDDHLLWIQPL